MEDALTHDYFSSLLKFYSIYLTTYKACKKLICGQLYPIRDSDIIINNIHQIIAELFSVLILEDLLNILLI